MLQNITKGTTVAAKLRVADTFGSRLRGLMGRPSLPEGEGLLITPCNAVHTLFMRFTIDVLFLDGHGRVVHSVAGLAPYRICAPVRNARCVVELPAGAVARSRTRVGDQLRMEGSPYAL